MRFYDNTCLLVLRVNSSLLAATIPLHPVIQQFSYLYYMWSQYPPSPSRCQYYDLAAGRFKYTDWTFMTAFADVVPDFGYERTGLPTLARSILINANKL